MWGEIESPAKTQPDLCDDSYKTPVESETRSPPGYEQICHTYPALFNLSSNRANSTNQDPLQDQAVSSSVSAMVEAVAQSGSLVKSQQIGEAELTPEQRRGELLQQYRSKPLVFLERYQAHLKPQHLVAFSHLRSDPRAQHYCRVIQRRATGHTDRTRVRNQRYAALRALQREGQYFSEDQMRMREPLLYEQYIGQYLNDEEVLERSQEAMQGGAEGCTVGTGGLAHLLLNSYQERLIQNRLQEEQEREECAQEEDEEEDEDGGFKEGEWEPTPQEKAQLREEFISQMHQRFLDGKDKDFNYSEVDENPDYDNLDIVNRDAEEKYFDNDEEEEEEEEQEEDADVQEEEDKSKMEVEETMTE